MASADHRRRRGYSGNNSPLSQGLKRCRVSRESVNLGQRFHDEARVKMINEIAHPIDGIIPGAVGILILQDEIQVSFCDSPVIFIRKNLRGARQQKSAISGSVNALRPEGKECRNSY